MSAVLLVSANQDRVVLAVLPHFQLLPQPVAAAAHLSVLLQHLAVPAAAVVWEIAARAVLAVKVMVVVTAPVVRRRPVRLAVAAVRVLRVVTVRETPAARVVRE